jgi:hypothetical protein
MSQHQVVVVLTPSEEEMTVCEKVYAAKPQKLSGVGMQGMLGILLVCFGVVVALGLRDADARVLFIALYGSLYFSAAFKPAKVGASPTRKWVRYLYGVLAWTATAILVQQHSWLFAVLSLIPSVRAVLLLNSHSREKFSFIRHLQKQRARSG